MTTPEPVRLYDVTIKEILDDESTFYMRAPLNTIMETFQLAKEARQRIIRETAITGTLCMLHFNGHGPFANRIVAVMKATRDLGINAP